MLLSDSRTSTARKTHMKSPRTQKLADRRATRLNCGGGKFVGCAVQSKREFFQVRRLPKGTAFPWPADECMRPRERRLSFGADVFGGDEGWNAAGPRGRDDEVPQSVLDPATERGHAFELSSSPESQTMQRYSSRRSEGAAAASAAVSSMQVLRAGVEGMRCFARGIARAV